MAEDMRFELTEAFTSPPFQDGALNHSANPPIKNKISDTEIKFKWCPRTDSNRHGIATGGF